MPTWRSGRSSMSQPSRGWPGSSTLASGELLSRRAVPIYRPAQSLFKAGACREAEPLACPRRVQHAPGLAGRLGEVESDCPFITGQPCHETHEVRDRDLESGADVDRLRIVVLLRRQHDPIGRVIDVQEFPRGLSVAPDDDLRSPLFLRLDALPD